MPYLNETPYPPTFETFQSLFPLLKSISRNLLPKIRKHNTQILTSSEHRLHNCTYGWTNNVCLNSSLILEQMYTRPRWHQPFGH